MENLIGALVGAPLLGAGILLVGGRRTNRFGHWLGTALAASSFVIGLVLFAAMLGRGGEDRTMTSHLYSWVPVEGFQADVAFQLDQLDRKSVV